MDDQKIVEIDTTIIMCKNQQQELSPKEVSTSRICCGVNRSFPASVTTPTSQNVRIDKYQSECIRRKANAFVDDHEFEWYDLDAIRKRDGSGEGKHDFIAGLVFTTTRQVLNEGVQVNRCITLSESSRQQGFEFDFFFWANRERKEDRRFRERFEELEQEIMSDSSSSLSGSSLSSLSFG